MLTRRRRAGSRLRQAVLGGRYACLHRRGCRRRAPHLVDPRLSVPAFNALELTLLYLAAAVVGVSAFRSFGLPPMLGYLVVGVLIGPHALALSGDMAHDGGPLKHLAEFGVVFLMFSIGLEFSLPKLRTMRRHVLGLGLWQVLLTIGATLALVGVAALVWRERRLPWGLNWQSALALGGALSMSSTAIVVKLLAERLELETEHGKRIVGVLLFQDLAVVPLIVLIPALAQPGGAMAQALGLAAAKAVLCLALILVFGQKIMRVWLHQVAKRKSQELFILNVLLIVLLLAYVTEVFGLSLALGAFLAGMLIAETPYKHEVEADIRPFREVLLGLFFITVGMLLDWQILLSQAPLVLLFFIVPTLFKFGLVWALARAFGASAGTSIRTALALAQSGEFGFVLLNLALSHRVLAPELLNPVLAGMVLSMLATPFIIQSSEKIALKLSSQEWMLQSMALTSLASRGMSRDQHVLILGFGRVGQNLARLLEAEKVPYLALDLDPDRVREAQAAGTNVSFGDAMRPEALVAAGIARAKVVAITFLGSGAALRILAAIQKVRPNVPVVVRTQDDLDLERLRAAGATEVVPESIEGSLMLASHALALAGVPLRRVLRDVQAARAKRYELLRGYFHGAGEDSDDEHAHDRLHSVTLPASSRWVGRQILALQLDDLYVDVAALKRGAQRVTEPADTERLAAGDTLVLRGKAEGLAEAEALLLS
jgi:CPA2 family monovalent cation:H+ antiporter-2